MPPNLLPVWATPCGGGLTKFSSEVQRTYFLFVKPKDLFNKNRIIFSSISLLFAILIIHWFNGLHHFAIFSLIQHFRSFYWPSRKWLVFIALMNCAWNGKRLFELVRMVLGDGHINIRWAQTIWSFRLQIDTIHQATTDGSRSVLLLEVPTKYRFGEDERGWGGGADGNLFCNKNGNWGLIIIYSWLNGTCSKSSSHCNILTQVLSKWCLQNKKPHEIFCTCLRLFTHKYTFLADKHTKSVAVYCDFAKHF